LLSNLLKRERQQEKLLDYEHGEFKQPYPSAETFRKMIHTFGYIQHVQRIVLPERPNVYLFKIQRHERGPIIVVWEKHDAFSGEGEPSATLTLKRPKTSVQAMDVFGETIPIKIIDDLLLLSISLTPVFIEPKGD
jgi:hypothetical protein